MIILLKKNQISPQLGKLENVLKQRLALSIGNVALSDFLRNFKTSGRNAGKSWAPLSALTKLWRRKGKGGGGAKPLLSTSMMMNSLHVVASPTKAEIRTNFVRGGRDIARVQQEGVKPYTATKKQIAWFRYRGVNLAPGSWHKNSKGKYREWLIPPRPFLVMSDRGKREISRLSDKYAKMVQAEGMGDTKE